MTDRRISVRDRLQAQLAVLRARQQECGGATPEWRASLTEVDPGHAHAESLDRATILADTPDGVTGEDATRRDQSRPSVTTTPSRTVGLTRPQARAARHEAVARIVRAGRSGSISERRVVGLSLSSEPDLVAAVEHHARTRSKQEKRLVFALAELLARGADLPGGLTPVDWLRTIDSGMSAASATAITRVARAMGETWWRTRGLSESLSGQGTDPLHVGSGGLPPTGRDTTQDPMREPARPVGVGHAAVVVHFAEQVRHVGDVHEVDDAIAHLWWQARHGMSQEHLSRMARELTAQIQPQLSPR